MEKFNFLILRWMIFYLYVLMLWKRVVDLVIVDCLEMEQLQSSCQLLVLHVLDIKNVFRNSIYWNSSIKSKETNAYMQLKWLMKFKYWKLILSLMLPTKIWKWEAYPKNNESFGLSICGAPGGVWSCRLNWVLERELPTGQDTCK